jgi:hypothetical protein
LPAQRDRHPGFEDAPQDGECLACSGQMLGLYLGAT